MNPVPILLAVIVCFFVLIVLSRMLGDKALFAVGVIGVIVTVLVGVAWAVCGLDYD